MLPSVVPPISVLQERKLKQKLWLEKIKKLEEKEIWLKEHPLIPDYKPRLTEPSPFWLVFFRQKQAFECTTAHPQDVHTFAFEPENLKNSTGKGLRKYLVTSYAQLWHTIKSLAHSERYGSFYEVIPEAAACKLYFDLEFRRDLNSDADGEAMVQILIKLVCFELQQFYGIHCSESHVINLDASTGSKFSRHLIFIIPGAIFKDNLHTGNFVQYLCRRIKSYCSHLEQFSNGSPNPSKGATGHLGCNENGSSCSDDQEPPSKKMRGEISDDESSSHGNQRLGQAANKDSDRKEFPEKDKLKNLYINVNDGGKELFIDTAVYTRNRNFRLFKCVKLGKSNPLLVAKDNRYQMKTNSKKKSPRSGGDDYHFFLDSIITHVKFAPHTKVLTCVGAEGSGRGFRRKVNYDGSNASKREERAEKVEGYQSSPFPEIDSYIRKYCISKGGVAGEIRRWTYFSEAQLLVYDIIQNRWCENIGRQHRSNNIMILVDLRRGVYYQKCHDQTCRAQNFKSDELPIPPEFLPSFTEWDEEELINVSIQVEEDARSNDMNLSTSFSDFDSFLDDGADEELMKLGERLDPAESGDNGSSSKQAMKSKTRSDAASARDPEERIRFAERLDSYRASVEDLGPHREDNEVRRTLGKGDDGWEDGITDDELLRSLQD
ncbi:DNA-directed primase/polymerase protein-like isoform X1 [Lytechinus pictus]|uniref:DNA-directed primase/polymerase protein-like isoform X1 n=1 Tax=Lytechinus pictus TaxID=7653 RepID=UPI0030BA2A1D